MTDNNYIKILCVVLVAILSFGVGKIIGVHQVRTATVVKAGTAGVDDGKYMGGGSFGTCAVFDGRQACATQE